MPIAANQPIATIAGNGVIFASASRTQAAYNSEAFTNNGARGVRLYVTNDNANSSTATAKIQVSGDGGANWTDLTGATTAALGSVTGSIITVYPGVGVSANVAVSIPLGGLWRVVLTIGTGTGTSKVTGEYLI